MVARTVLQFQKTAPFYKYTHSEYLDLSIQFGFVILFSSAFPLAPLFALLNNFIKIRTNAKQLTKYSKRTVPIKTNSIGIWENVFRFLAFFSIVTNVSCLTIINCKSITQAITISFTSSVIEKLVYAFDHGSIEGFLEYRNFCQFFTKY